nr:mitogen-activated protein kinase kinase kinase [Tanacetum cinerariifolium]
MTTEGTQRNQEREKSSHRKLKQKRMEKSGHRNIKQKLGESKAKADGDCGLSKVNEHIVVSGGVRRALPSMAPEPFRGKSRFVTDKFDV